MAKEAKVWDIVKGENELPLSVTAFNDEYVVSMEIPDVTNVPSVSVMNGVLNVTAYSNGADVEEGGVIVLNTRKNLYSDFSMQLPDDCKLTKTGLAAKYRDGIFSVTIDRRSAPAPVVIKVKRGFTLG